MESSRSALPIPARSGTDAEAVLLVPPPELWITVVAAPELSTGAGQKSRKTPGVCVPQPVDEPVETVDSPELLCRTGGCDACESGAVPRCACQHGPMTRWNFR